MDSRRKGCNSIYDAKSRSGNRNGRAHQWLHCIQELNCSAVCVSGANLTSWNSTWRIYGWCCRSVVFSKRCPRIAGVLRIETEAPDIVAETRRQTRDNQQGTAIDTGRRHKTLKLPLAAPNERLLFLAFMNTSHITQHMAKHILHRCRMPYGLGALAGEQSYKSSSGFSSRGIMAASWTSLSYWAMRAGSTVVSAGRVAGSSIRIRCPSFISFRAM